RGGVRRGWGGAGRRLRAVRVRGRQRTLGRDRGRLQRVGSSAPRAPRSGWRRRLDGRGPGPRRHPQVHVRGGRRAVGDGSERRALHRGRVRDAQRPALRGAAAAEGLLTACGRTACAVGLAVAGALAPGAAPAQRLDVWIDAAAAHARPPGGVAGAEAATYGMLGAQLRAETRGGKSFDLRAHGGRSAEVDGGAWLEGAAQVWTGGQLAGWHLSGRAELFGLRYT